MLQFMASVVPLADMATSQHVHITSFSHCATVNGTSISTCMFFRPQVNVTLIVIC